MSTFLPFWKAATIAALLVGLLSASGAASAPPPPQKGMDNAGPASPPSVEIQNTYLKALSSTGGRFLIGTTGGDPNTPNDDNKRLLYGYPSNVGTSFSTVRIINGAATSDYRLGSTTWSSTGIPPVSPPTSSGSKITSVWNQDGIRIEENLYFTQNPDTGRPDTTAIEYILRNNNSSSRSVGLRIMLDVMVGGNDGAPYFIEGTGRVTQQSEWRGGNVPAYWISYESATFAADSLKGRGQLSGADTTRPDRFVVADWPQAHATVWDYTVNPQDAVTDDSAVILYFNPVTLGAGQTRTYRTYYGINRSGDVAQLELTGLEVTQAIQNWENDVQLVGGKRAVVRAHVRSTSGNVAGVKAKLIGTRIGPGGSRTSLGEVVQDNVGGEITVLNNPEPQRSNLGDSFYFILPFDWRSGTVELEFRGVNRNFLCRDHVGTDDDCKVQITFGAAPVLEVRFVGIAYDHDGQTYRPRPGDYWELADRLEAVYPIAELDWEWSERSYATKPSLDRVNSDLESERFWDGCWLGCRRIYYGVLLDCDSGSCDEGGLAAGIPAWVSSGYMMDYAPLRHAHEIGHDLGRHHAEFCGAEAYYEVCLPIIGCQRIYPPGYQAYPYADGYISPQNSGEDLMYYGFDVNALRDKTLSRVVKGPNWADLMTYCYARRRLPGRWISDWTYEGIFQKVRNWSVLQADALWPDATAVQSVMLVKGQVNLAEQTGELHPIFVNDVAGAVTLPTEGAYALSFADASGSILRTIHFDPEIQTDPNSDGQSLGSYAFVVPYDVRYKRVTLSSSVGTMATRVASVNPPIVTLLSPNGGEVLSGTTAMLAWQGADPDGDTLEYVLQYSVDAGANWRMLVSGLRSTSYLLNLDAIPGSDQALIRVIASDGFLTAHDQSDGTFRVAKHVPQVRIELGSTDNLYVGDQQVLLEGGAYDHEDGQLSDSALVWTSSLSGVLGAGRSFAISAAALPEGLHTISLSARDNDGQSSSATVEVRVARARPNLPARLVVTPVGLSFVAQQGGGQADWQTLSIRNNGDGALSWTVSGNQPWLRLSSLTGVAPSDILVAADPTGLAPGEYSGSVTITAPVANSPQSVDVSLTIVERHTHALYLPIILNRSGGSGDQLWHTAAGLSGHSVYDLSSTVTTCNTLFAGTDNGVYRSLDGGLNWTWAFAPAAALAANGPPPVYEGPAQPEAGMAPAVVVCPANPSIVYAGGWGSGVYRSADGGYTWQQRAGGLSDPWIYDLAVNPTNCDVVYAATSSSGIFKTTDGGGAWQAAVAGLGNTLTRAVAVTAANPSQLYVGTTAGVYRSDNAAASWLATGSLPGVTAWALTTPPGNADQVYVGLDGYGVYRSANRGSTWGQANNGLGNVKTRALIVDPSAAAILYAGRDDGGGVYRSLNGGDSWLAFNDGLGSRNIKALWLAGGSCRRLFAGTGSGVWYFGP